MIGIVGSITAILGLVSWGFAYFGWVFGIAYGVAGLASMTTFSFLGVAGLILSSIFVGIGATIGFVVLAGILIKAAQYMIK